MSEQQNVDAVCNVYAAFGRGDLEGTLALLDPEVSWRPLGRAVKDEGMGRLVDFRWVHVFTFQSGRLWNSRSQQTSVRSCRNSDASRLAQLNA